MKTTYSKRIDMKILEFIETEEGWFPKKWETYTGKLFIHTDQKEENDV